MSTKETILKIETKKDINKNLQFFNNLKLDELLKEIRDNVWEYGEIKIQTPNSDNQQKLYFPFHTDKDDLLIELTARWPKFVPDHFEKTPYDISDVYIKPGVKITGPSIYIKVNPSLTEIITSEECKPFKDGYDSTRYIFLESNLNFSEEEIIKFKDEIKNTITEFCTQGKLKDISLKDRQEIIEKIKFGELSINDIPKNFLSEETMISLIKQLQSKIKTLPK